MSDDRDLDLAIRQLPRSIEPPGDLWPDIATRIDTRARMRRRMTIAGALAAAAAALLVWNVQRPHHPAHALAGEWTAALTQPSVAPAAAPEPAAQGTILIPGEDELRRAASELAGAFDRRRPLLDRELLAVYDENLDIVDDAIDRSRAALVTRPADPHLQRVLDRAYRHKLALLRRASSEEMTP